MTFRLLELGLKWEEFFFFLNIECLDFKNLKFLTKLCMPKLVLGKNCDLEWISFAGSMGV